MRIPQGPLTLRGRLLSALLVFSAVGLIVFAGVSALLLRHSLLVQVDQRLQHLLVHRIAAAGRPNLQRLPSDSWMAIVGSNGIVQYQSPPQLDQPGSPALTAGNLTALRSHVGTPFTVPDQAKGSPWRVDAGELADHRIVVVALSLGSVDAVVRPLLIIEGIVGGIVLTCIGIVATVAVRLGLRPLTTIEHTAEAIAGGELDRRVPDSDPRTETGRLGAALNVMLGRLAEAIQQRERSEHRLRQFIADASHELRTPLTSIRGFAELYRRGGAHTPAEMQLLTSRIEAEATRMSVLVDDLLLLARLDQQRALDVTEIDLLVLAADAVHDAKAREPDRPITLIPDNSPVHVLGDEHKLRQVLTNLVTNALTHTPAGTPVQLKVHNQTSATADDQPPVATAGARNLPDGALGVLEVHDEGPGIPPDQAPHVFDRFYSADPHSLKNRSGTGLGLAITAAILEAHHGRIELHTTPHNGTTFRVLLPMTS